MASKEVLAALEELHLELNKLEPAIKHVEMAELVIKTVGEVPQKHLDLLKEINTNDKKFKDDLKSLFSEEMVIITEENKKLVMTTKEIQSQVKIDLETLERLAEQVKSFHDRVEKVNFPERLDKLDANISGIMSAIQAVQSRLDSLERNIADRIKDVSEAQKESRIAIIASIVTLSKKQKTSAYITWFLIVLGLILTSILIKL